MRIFFRDVLAKIVAAASNSEPTQSKVKQDEELSTASVPNLKSNLYQKSSSRLRRNFHQNYSAPNSATKKQSFNAFSLNAKEISTNSLLAKMNCSSPVNNDPFDSEEDERL